MAFQQVKLVLAVLIAFILSLLVVLVLTLRVLLVAVLVVILILVVVLAVILVVAHKFTPFYFYYGPKVNFYTKEIGQWKGFPKIFYR